MPNTPSSSGQSRGRPELSDEDIAGMRRHIADCALKLFEEHGYEAVSMRRLATEAGCTTKTLYRYFDRKIDILRQLWGEIFTDLFGQLDAIAARKKEARERLDAIALGYVTYWLQQRDRYFMVFMSSGVSQPDVSVFVEDDVIVVRFQLIFKALADALDTPASPEDIHLRAQLLLCALNGIAHNLITISAYPWDDPEKLVRAAVSGALTAELA